MTDMSGKIWTVTGPISPEHAGITLMHEHLFHDEETAYFQVPDDEVARKFAYQPVTIKNRGWIINNWPYNLDNLRFNDEDVATEEVLGFKTAGGKTIVEATSNGLSPNPVALRSIAIKTGINIISGCGYYTVETHPAAVESKNVGEIAAEIISDVKEGVGTSGIRSGIIGEIGNSWPWHPNEQKICLAASQAQRETGAPIEIHPGRSPNAPGPIIELLESEGVDLDRVIICHVERTVHKLSDFKAIADSGCYLEFDSFGQFYYPTPLEFDFPNDHVRITLIKQLIDAGYVDKILLSHDIDNKILMSSYGGHGYAHLLTNIVPLMRRRGITEDQIQKMMVKNPCKVLTFT